MNSLVHYYYPTHLPLKYKYEEQLLYSIMTTAVDFTFTAIVYQDHFSQRTF